VISGVSVSPGRRRLGLYWQLHTKNLQQPEVCAFLRHLLRHLRGPVIVLWDNGKIHQGLPLRHLCHDFPRLRLERLPAYAPELNPDEGVWKLAKGRLANGRPDVIGELRADVAGSLKTIARSPRLLRGCFEGSELPPF
jgi:transposase